MITDTYIEVEKEEKIPLEAWPKLVYYLRKYWLTTTRDGTSEEDSALSFLKNGRKLSLPSTINLQGETVPYQIWPTQAANFIEACVGYLGYRYKTSGTSSLPQNDDLKVVTGVLMLAEQLFPHTVAAPNGRFHLHYIDTNLELATHKHTKKIKRLAQHLSDFRQSLLSLSELNKQPIQLPELNSLDLVNQETQSSKKKFLLLLAEGYTGDRIDEAIDSLDTLKENKGFDPKSEEEFLEENPQNEIETLSEAEEEYNNTWSGGPLPKEKALLNTQRGNITTTPKDWIWDYQEDPLEFTLEYTANHSLPCLLQALEILQQANHTQSFEEITTKALVINPAHKTNPDSLWRIIKRISNNFPDDLPPESEKTLQKLDCARFSMSLQKLNKEWGVNHQAFLTRFHSKLHNLMETPSYQNALRNQILIDTFLETSNNTEKNYTIKDAEIWLEHLQSKGVGTYENSPGMDRKRKNLLNKLNTAFHTLHNNLKKSGMTAQLEQQLETLSKQLIRELSGPTGQTTRRELRSQLTSLKTEALERNDTACSENLEDSLKYLASIPSQIKSGAWYESLEYNILSTKKLLKTILTEPKIAPQFFPGSKKPEPQPPLIISLDFLKSHIESKDSPTGGHKINSYINAARDIEKSKEGQKIQEAIAQISKNLNISQQSAQGIFEERKKSLTAALEIATTIHSSEQAWPTLERMCQNALEIVKTANLKPQETIEIPEDLTADEIDILINNIQNATQQFQEALQKNCLKKFHFEKSAEQYQLGIALAAAPHTKQYQLEKKLIESLQNLNRVTCQGWEKNYFFWKGLMNICLNIKARQDNPPSLSGEGILQNILAITKAKSENRIAGLSQNRQTPTQGLQFQMWEGRARKLLYSVAVPVANWLSKKEKGVKTKITQEEFESALQQKITGCEIMLQLCQENNNINATVAQFKNEQKVRQNNINQSLIADCLELLKDPAKLAESIRGIEKNMDMANTLQATNPELDNPLKIWSHLTQTAPEKTNNPPIDKTRQTKQKENCKDPFENYLEDDPFENYLEM